MMKTQILPPKNTLTMSWIRSHIESKQHDIAIAHNVLLALLAHVSVAFGGNEILKCVRLQF
jgi:hypothetical protein